MSGSETNHEPLKSLQQVWAKLGGNFQLLFLVCHREDAKVWQVAFARVPDRHDGVPIKYSEKLRLIFNRQGCYLIKYQCTLFAAGRPPRLTILEGYLLAGEAREARGYHELAEVVGDSASKRTPAMTKQLAFEEVR